jgi:hypothetical protein
MTSSIGDSGAFAAGSAAINATDEIVAFFERHSKQRYRPRVVQAIFAGWR